MVANAIMYEVECSASQLGYRHCRSHFYTRGSQLLEALFSKSITLLSAVGFRFVIGIEDLVAREVYEQRHSTTSLVWLSVVG